MELSPAEILAWEESIALEGVDQGYAWAWAPTIPTAVLGLGQEASRELWLKALQRDGIAVIRRSSGGGAVLLAPGVLCCGLIAPPQWCEGLEEIRTSFRVLAQPLVATCRSLGLEADFAGISDIAVRRSTPEEWAADSPEVTWVKIAGCAQLRKKKAVLVHASLLVDLDLRLLDRYLPMPSEMPAYRNGRGHTEFCQTLALLLKRRMALEEVEAIFRKEVEKGGRQWKELPETLPPLARKIYEEKMGREGWNLRRERSRPFPSAVIACEEEGGGQHPFHGGREGLFPGSGVHRQDNRRSGLIPGSAP